MYGLSCNQNIIRLQAEKGCYKYKIFIICKMAYIIITITVMTRWSIMSDKGSILVSRYLLIS